MVRFATIGSNFVAEWFWQAAAKCPGYRLRTVYSRDAEKAAKLSRELGAERFTDSLDAIAADPDVDAVYIASPHYCHEEQIELFLLADKHVLCEKAIVPSLPQYERLYAIAKQRGLILMEATRSLHNPVAAAVRDALEQIAPVRGAQLNFCQYSSRYDKFKAGIVENAFDPTLQNGALLDVGVYPVSMMVYLFGMPEEVVARGWFLPQSIDAAGSMLCRYGDDLLVQIAYSKVNNSLVESEICGEGGSILIPSLVHPENAWLQLNKQERVPLLTEPREALDMVYEINDFIAYVEAGRMPAEFHRCSADALRVMDEVRRQIGIDFTRKA